MSAIIMGSDIYKTDTIAQHKLGQDARFSAEDLRVFRYGYAGASTCAKGKLAVSRAVVANHVNLTCAVAALGATKITVTLGGTAVVQDEYAQGTVTINAGTGLGQTYKIIGHPAQASTSGTVELAIDRPLVVAIDATSKATLTYASYGAVLNVSTGASARRAAGVPLVDIVAGAYGWFQVKGDVGVLCDGTPAEGATIVASTSVAGAVAAASATIATYHLQLVLGKMASIGVDTEYKVAKLDIV